MIGLIDADHISFIICYNKKDEPVKTLEECIDGANQYLMRLINRLDLTEVHLFFTLTKCFRYKYNPNYKAGRSSERPLHFYEVRDYLVKTYKGIWDLDLESDDLVAIYKKRYKEENKEFITISPDKDILYLEGSNYNPKNDKLIEVTVEEEGEYFWKSMIIGDNADTIKGIPKRGKSFANKLFLNIDDVESYRNLVLNEYINYFGEEKGIDEFYKNFKCLKIVDNYEGIIFREPIKVASIYAEKISLVK